MWRPISTIAFLLVSCKIGQPSATATPTEPAVALQDAHLQLPNVTDEIGKALTWRTASVEGTDIEYATAGKPSARANVLIALPPGPQTRDMVAMGLEPWAESMAADGWFVISPVSPKGLFADESAAVLPAFLDAVVAEHSIGAKKLFLFGMSNGGLSAFKLALAQPERFAALVTIPGRPADDDMDNLATLATMRITMVVGTNDTEFWTAGAKTAKVILEAADAPVNLQYLSETGHAAHLDFDWPALRAMFVPKPARRTKKRNKKRKKKR